MKRLAVLSLAILSSSACSSAKIDGSSAATCEESLRSVAQSAEDDAAFAAAYMEISAIGLFAELGSSLLSAWGYAFDSDAVSVPLEGPDSPAPDAALCEALHGADANTIVTKTDSLRGVYAAALERISAESELSQLREARERFELARDSLAAFQVLDADLSQEQGFVGLETTISLRVKNATSHPVSRAFFRARVISPGRSIPWIEEDFNYSISGGLEPGEEASWRLQPNMFTGGWDTAVPADAQMTVTVIRLDGPDEEEMWGGARFTRGDSLLLDSLTQRFAGR